MHYDSTFAPQTLGAEIRRQKRLQEVWDAEHRVPHTETAEEKKNRLEKEQREYAANAPIREAAAKAEREAEEKAKQDAADLALSRARQHLLNLEGRWKLQRDERYVYRDTAFGSIVTDHELSEARADVARLLTPVATDRVLPSVPVAEYEAPSEPLYVPKVKVPGVCETCHAAVDDCSIALSKDHKDADGNICVINWKKAISSGVRQPIQAKNLGIEPWASSKENYLEIA
jgi:hypothetical protein